MAPTHDARRRAVYLDVDRRIVDGARQLDASGDKVEVELVDLKQNQADGERRARLNIQTTNADGQVKLAGAALIAVP